MKTIQKNSMKRMVFYCFMALLPLMSFGQKWKQTTYSSFLKEYSGLLNVQPKELYEIGMSTSVYKTISDATPVVQQKSQLSVFKNNNYMYSSEASIQIQKDDLKIDIDTLEKRVMLSKGIAADLLGYNPKQFDHIDSTKYTFYVATEGDKRYLRVVENNRVSSMQTVSFVFNKTSKHLLRMEMIYWPGNFMMASLDDESIEQPKVAIDYLDFHTITTTDSLDKEFASWIRKESGSKEFTCPQSAYTLYNLLQK